MANALKRCAVYTRKSSEEGLEQDYNSLHAQREACEAFIKSQAGEGWRLVITAYDDGGFSGGAMERPALQRLLADIRQGLVEIVVVYKVDRLTRSLTDFAKMVELFDAKGVSFVAVTQQFNTTTSMGRLTLNVLLSFAQFEREVIGERIRDKIAASKRKGIWVGGSLPIGYEARERKLVVNQDEAKTVKQMFERYLALGSVRLLKNDLDRRGIVSRTRISKKGNSSGGKAFSRGALYHLLSNPIYIGEIRHRHERHPGQHQAIISRELWEHVQQRLHDRQIRCGEGGKTTAPNSPLAGKLFDETGESLYVQGAAKGHRRYRYYVSKRLVRREAHASESTWRIAAPEIERAIGAAVGAMLADRAAIVLAFEQAAIDPIQLPSVLNIAQAGIERLKSKDGAKAVLDALLERVELRRVGIRVSMKLPLPLIEAGEDSKPAYLHLAAFTPMQLKRRGVEMRMVLESHSVSQRIDLSLLKAIARTRRWANDLMASRVQSVRELARREGIDARSVRRLIPLGFLSPRVVDAVAEGRQPVELTLEALTRRVDLPIVWSAQHQTLGVC